MPPTLAPPAQVPALAPLGAMPAGVGLAAAVGVQIPGHQAAAAAHRTTLEVVGGYPQATGGTAAAAHRVPKVKEVGERQ